MNVRKYCQGEPKLLYLNKIVEGKKRKRFIPLGRVSLLGRFRTAMQMERESRGLKIDMSRISLCFLFVLSFNGRQRTVRKMILSPFEEGGKGVRHKTYGQTGRHGDIDLVI